MHRLKLVLIGHLDMKSSSYWTGVVLGHWAQRNKTELLLTWWTANVNVSYLGLGADCERTSAFSFKVREANVCSEIADRGEKTVVLLSTAYISQNDINFEF